MSTYTLNETHGGTTHSGQTPEELDLATMLGFAHSVMIIAAADGELSTTEMNTFLGMMTAFGMPPQGVEALRGFDPHGKKLEDHLPSAHRSMLRHFLYDAIKVARSDGYHEAERRSVRQAAALGGIPEAVVTAIEGLIEIESSVRSARLALLRDGA